MGRTLLVRQKSRLTTGAKLVNNTLQKLEKMAELAESVSLRDLIAQAITRATKGATIPPTVLRFLQWRVDVELNTL
jgi:hypothetical protein